MDKRLTDAHLVGVAREAGIEPAALKAFAMVESAGSGFLGDGRCKILFEGHVFWRQLSGMGVDPRGLSERYPTIVYPTWTKQHYVGGAGEYNRLEQAMKISREAALKSTSWGMFQIMGFNYFRCGYNRVDDMVDDMQQSELKHLEIVLRFLSIGGFRSSLEQHDWATLARRYNGPLYAQNQYDVKLKKAYEQYLYLNEKNHGTV